MPGPQTASKTEREPVEIKLAHSPDSDDAFMFYALATHKLSTPGYKYTHILSDIQSLNEAALSETYDVTAISFCRLPHSPRQVHPCSIAVPVLVKLRPHRRFHEVLKPQELAGKRIAVPGLKTSAYLTLKLYQPNFEPVVMPSTKSSTPFRRK